MVPFYGNKAQPYFRYLEVLLRRASMGQLLHSDHLQSFITNPDAAPSGGAILPAEQYTDTRG